MVNAFDILMEKGIDIDIIVKNVNNPRVLNSRKDYEDVEFIHWPNEDIDAFAERVLNIYLRSNMSEFSVVSEYYNKQHKITAKIIKEDERFWLMMIPKDQGLKYYDDISQIEAMLKIKNFEKIEKSKD